MIKKLIILIITFLVGINFIYAKEKVTFSDCVDGDTIKVEIDGKKKTVRLLAIDTPESVKPNSEVEYYGKEASNYTCKTIKNAKKIELEYDDNSDKTDKYDRILAWVFVDDKLLQEKLVEKGYAKVAYLYNDYKYTSILKEKQELASAKGLGIWNEEAFQAFIKSSGEGQGISNDIESFTNKEILVIVILFLIIVFVGDKAIKKKAKKKLSKYLG